MRMSYLEAEIIQLGEIIAAYNAVLEDMRDIDFMIVGSHIRERRLIRITARNAKMLALQELQNEDR